MMASIRSFSSVLDRAVLKCLKCCFALTSWSKSSVADVAWIAVATLADGARRREVRLLLEDTPDERLEDCRVGVGLLAALSASLAALCTTISGVLFSDSVAERRPLLDLKMDFSFCIFNCACLGTYPNLVPIPVRAIAQQNYATTSRNPSFDALPTRTVVPLLLHP
jgi:hypothetical protein